MTPLLIDSFRAAVRAARPAAAMRRHLPPPPPGRIIVIGAGKAAAEMAAAAEDFYPPGVPLSGAVVIPHGAPAPALTRIKILRGAHPVPDAASARAARRILKEAKNATSSDLALALLSGGGSSLLGAPAAGLQLRDCAQIVAGLLQAGADVREINAVRRHLGAAAGGRLAAICRAPMRALIMSDVLGNQPADIASGPCAADPSSCADVLSVLDRFGVSCPPAVAALLQNGTLETPKKPELFADVENIIVAGARRSLAAGATTLRRGGVRTVRNLGARGGNVEDLAAMHRKHLDALQSSPRPAAVVSGGEAECPVRGKGAGGRNSEFALRLWMQTPSQVSAVACDTDGVDGRLDAAGAAFDRRTRERAANLPPQAAARSLARSDSGAFWRRLDALVETGPTGVNVSDYRACILE